MTFLPQRYTSPVFTSTSHRRIPYQKPIDQSVSKWQKFKKFLLGGDFSYGISTFKIKSRSFPHSPQFKLRQIRDSAQDLSEKENLKSMYTYALQDILIDRKCNQDFIKYYDKNIMDPQYHLDILNEFFNSPYNLANKLMKEKHISTHQISENERESKLKAYQNEVKPHLMLILSKVYINSMIAKPSTKEHLLQWGAPYNSYFSEQQQSLSASGAGRFLNKAFISEGKDNTMALQVHCVNNERHEGPGKVQMLANYMNSELLCTFPFFGGEWDVEVGGQMSIALLPEFHKNPLKCFDINLNFLMKVPDVLGVFPSSGFIYSKSFIGIGAMANWDMKLNFTTCVVFQVGMEEVGFIQITITRNLFAILQIIGENISKWKLLFRSIFNKNTLHNNIDSLLKYYENTYSTTMERLDITIGKIRKTRRYTLSKILNS